MIYSTFDASIEAMKDAKKRKIAAIAAKDYDTAFKMRKLHKLWFKIISTSIAIEEIPLLPID